MRGLFLKKKYNKKEIILLSIYFIGFLLGTISHLIDIGTYGLFGYTFAPYVINVFWTSLTFLDVLVLVILILRIRIGIIMAITIMASDIAVNVFFSIYSYIQKNQFIMWGIVTQILFGIFVFVSAGTLLKYKSLRNAIGEID